MGKKGVKSYTKELLKEDPVVVSSENSKQKIYIIDTNAIIENPNCMIKLGEGGNCVVIPTVVLYELDKHAKSKDPQKLFPAIEAKRLMNDLRRDKKVYHSISEAMNQDSSPSFPNGGKFSWTGEQYLTVSSNIEADDQILKQSLSIKKRFSNLADVVLVTEDGYLQLKANSQDLSVEELKMGKVSVRNPDQLYSGVSEFLVSRDLLDAFLASDDELGRYVTLPDLINDLKEHKLKLIWNQCVILRDKEKSSDYVLTKYNPDSSRLECLKNAISINKRQEEADNLTLFRKNFFVKSFFDTTPRDEYQIFYMDFLVDNKIKFLVVNGRGGTGKTRLSVAAALHYLIDKNKLDNKIEHGSYKEKDFPLKKEYPRGVLLLKPEIAIIDYGFLPGDINEKIDPFLDPFYKTLEDLTCKYEVNHSILDILKERGILNTKATAFLRGVNIDQQISIIDEMQNGNRAMAILYVSRLCNNSKNIAMGDIYQIDNQHVGINNNALSLLTETIQKRPRPDSAVITLKKGYRLKLASEYADLLSGLNV